MIHFAASISDRGDDGFDHFTEIAERRRAFRTATPRSPTGKPASVAVGGYVVHEVHVIHHVVHHVIAPRAD